ncbi:unnamed protein product [Adineta steineri]|uniref:Uncharacterized protein n=1 Tax=Adineta steineri TaxID=433720 RepID=A0A819J5P2_9BILA|nr:unnamed protein product [Adineta steineri]CAF3924960.1 unnamed protein product [Adineta steineri]
MFSHLNNGIYCILILVIFKSTIVDNKNCSSSYQKTCSLGSLIWCCPAISNVECGSEIFACHYRTIPTFRPIMFQYVTRPDFLNRPISHAPSSSGLILVLEIVSGIFFVCCIYIPLIYLIIRTCWRCCLRVSPRNQRIVELQQMTGQSTLNISTPYDSEQSVSTISSIFEALPPPYHIAIDKNRSEVSPPSYDIALTHLVSVHQLQSFPTTTVIEDIILQV